MISSHPQAPLQYTSQSMRLLSHHHTSTAQTSPIKMVKVLENRVVDLDLLPGTKEQQEAALRAK